MIIEKGLTNNVSITVSEQTTLAGPFYLFEFISKQTKSASYCISRPTSSARYDSFSITETATPNPLNGEVSLSQGEYTYNVYQQASSSNLDPTLTTPALYNSYVETGVLVVPSSGTDSTTYTGATTTNVVYNG